MKSHMLKYILLFTMLIVANGVQSATTMSGDNSINSDALNTGSFGDSNSIDTRTFGGGGVDTRTFGGSGIDTRTFGGGGVDTRTFGDGNANSGGLAPIEKPELSIPGFVNWFIKLLNYVVILILGLALVCFFYGVFILMFVEGDKEESRAQGRKFMMWGILSLFVMISTWGLVSILTTSIFGPGSLILPSFK